MVMTRTTRRVFQVQGGIVVMVMVIQRLFMCRQVLNHLYTCELL